MLRLASAIPSTATTPVPLPGGRSLTFNRPLVMGILNVTPDSFSDGGRYPSVDAAVERAEQMIREGADIIDIGGESSRPGAKPAASDEERRRVIPVLAALRRQSDIPISIDTYHAATARAAISEGADIINDISALRFDTDMPGVVSKTDAGIVLMHMLGSPQTMQEQPSYDNCVEEISAFFGERLDLCRSCGIDPERVILDPGIGFGKRLMDNVDIIAHMRDFRSWGRPLMIGVSRKSFIQQLTRSDEPPAERIGGSLASALIAVTNGAQIVRVHDVGPTVAALRVAEAITESGTAE